MFVTVEEPLIQSAAKLATARAVEIRREMFRKGLFEIMNELRAINAQRVEIFKTRSSLYRWWKKEPDLYAVEGSDENIIKVLAAPIELEIDHCYKNGAGLFIHEDAIYDFLEQNLAWNQLGFDEDVFVKCMDLYSRFPVTKSEREARGIATKRRFEAVSVMLDLETWNWINSFAREITESDTKESFH